MVVKRHGQQLQRCWRRAKTEFDKTLNKFICEDLCSGNDISNNSLLCHCHCTSAVLSSRPFPNSLEAVTSEGGEGEHSKACRVQLAIRFADKIDWTSALIYRTGLWLVQFCTVDLSAPAPVLASLQHSYKEGRGSSRVRAVYASLG